MGEKQKADHDGVKKELAFLRKEKADLQRSLNHKEAILNGLPAGFVVIQKGKIIDANEVFLNELGYTAKEVLGQDFRAFVPARLKLSVGGIYGKQRSEKAGSDPHEVELIGKDGSVLGWDTKVQKIRANGRRAFLLMLTRNEERKKREGHLAESLKMGALRTMASGLSKALKNPMKVIQDGVGLAWQSPGPGPLEVRKRIEDAVTSMETVGNAMECLTKEVPDESLWVPFDLRKVVKEALAAGAGRVKEEAEKGRTDIRVKTYLRSVSSVEGDPEEIRQMLSHLVTNALDAMPRGGYLYLSTEENAGYAHIYVQDSGVGIPPQIRERVLDPFFTTKEAEKPGLGLSLSRAIIRRHRGEMEINSKENEGTMVTVRLPLAKREGQDKQRSPRRRSIKNARILMMEEDPVIGDLLLRTLESKGCKVTVAASAAEGLQQVGKKAFDLVIVGTMVSELKGETLVRRLKKSKKAPPVALIVDYDIREGTRAGREALADLMISKPIDMNQAIERITEIIGARP
jgi:PAS domain S-box-containing protein